MLKRGRGTTVFREELAWEICNLNVSRQEFPSDQREWQSNDSGSKHMMTTVNSHANRTPGIFLGIPRKVAMGQRSRSKT
jgi:hypothetical protein